MARLQECARVLAYCGLREVDYSGYLFTWSNKRKAPHTVEERIDYALVNDKWLEQWPVTHVSHLPRYRSDHNPIRLVCGTRRRSTGTRRERVFRFEEVWLQKGEECSEVIAETWSRVRGDCVSRLACVGDNLDSWGRESFGDISGKVADMRVKLQSLQRREQTEHVVKETMLVEGQLDNLLEQEEILWCQRSRVTWLRHGDRNTGFFHRKASQRRQRNTFEVLKTEDGRKVEEDKDIYQVLADYFMGLFSSAGPVDTDSVTSLKV